MPASAGERISSRSQPTPPLDDTEIDLADLVDCPVPRNRMILLPASTAKQSRACGSIPITITASAAAPGAIMSTGWCRSRASNTTTRSTSSTIGTARSSRDRKRATPRKTPGAPPSALKWWDAAKPITGTLAARYLADIRGIDLDALPADIDDALRFHPHCVFGPGTVHPCLLALMRDPISDAPTGIQRTALTADARKIDRMMLGPAGVVKLWPAGKQLVDRRRAGDDARRRHPAALSRRAVAAGLGGALGRRHEAISRHRRRRAADPARRQRPQRRGADRGGSLQATLAGGRAAASRC